MTAKGLLADALKLSSAERAELADALWRSVDTSEEDLSLSPEQRADLDLRIAEDDAGRSDPQDWTAFRSKLREEPAT